ncbi:MAG: GGDEF domain-containing response regulator [Candidatus Hinthialibacter sp.]
MKVIIADDDTGTRLLLEHALTKWDYDVVSFSNGLEAIQNLLKEKESCLAILDWVMPEMDGIEVCRLVRERRSDEGYIYVVILTGKQRKEDIVEGLEAGADDFLVKPFDFHELQMRLRVGARILSLQDKLKKLAYHDSLTDTLNRMAILKYLDMELQRTQRKGDLVSVVMTDLDHFKKLNDSYGHLCGDAVLQKCAECMKRNVRAYDMVGRYGGEEFLIVVPGIDRNETYHLAERLRLILSQQPIEYEGQVLTVTISMGISDSSLKECTTLDSIIRVADEALYQAKRQGRNQVAVASGADSKKSEAKENFPHPLP